MKWLMALCVAIASSAAGARGEDPDPRWGRIANPGFVDQRIRSTLFFAGQARDGSNPYSPGYVPASNLGLYTVHPVDPGNLNWFSSPANRDLALGQMVSAGLNVVSMSSWGESWLAPKDSWGPYAPMQVAPQAQDELFAAAVGQPLLITPFIESRGNWAMRYELPTYPGQTSPAPGTVSQVEDLVNRYLKNPAHPEWAQEWTQVYNRDGEARYAVSLIQASSQVLSASDDAAYAAAFDAISQKVFDDTGVKVGFFLDALPRNSPWAPGTFKPSPETTGPLLAQEDSILGLQDFIPEIWADVSSEADRIAWKRDFSSRWADTGIPFLMDVSPGYDAHVVFPGSPYYGYDDTWTTALTDMVKQYGDDGLVYNSWNGYTEGMAAMPTVESGDKYYQWLGTLTRMEMESVPEPSSLIAWSSLAVVAVLISRRRRSQKRDRRR